MSSTIHVYCDLCSSEIDKTEQTKGFAAVSIIAIHYDFQGLKATKQGLERKDFDICYECSEKLSKYLEESKKAISDKKDSEKVENKEDTKT